MKRTFSTSLTFVLLLSVAVAQTPQKPRQEPVTEDIVRISTELVQTDVVVTDKNDQAVTDLKLEDFELYENGKKQDLQFVEFVSVDAPRRTDGLERSAKIAPGVDTSVARDLTAKDVRRVVAFVVDDVTIPSEDMARVRQMLSNFVDNKMLEGDLVAIVRTVGGKGLLEQFTTDRQILRRAISQLNVIVYNGKLDNSKPKLRSRLIISHGDKVLFQEAEQPVESPGSGPGQFVRIGQIGLSKVAPGRYVLTLVVTDPLGLKATDKLNPARRERVAWETEVRALDRVDQLAKVRVV